ncbi:multidrug efflux system outer membrane protein [Oxalobacteraceae bacterium GrIS 1.11]
MRVRTRALSLLLAGLLAACAAPRDDAVTRPAPVLAGAWAGAVPVGSAWPQRDWWRAYGSAELNALLLQLQDNNTDLQGALARVRQARAGLAVAGADLAPQVAVGAGAVRAKARGADAANLFSITPQLSYGFDLWGGAGAARDAARAALQSSLYAQEALRLSLSAATAATYFEILSLDERMVSARAGLDNARTLLALVQAQADAGKVAALELEQQLGVLAAVGAALPPLAQQRRQKLDALAVLLGRDPSAFALAPASLRGVNLPPVGVGLPSELLRRRPDIGRAEADLAGASANIAVARAAFFPQVTLGAQAGASGATLAGLSSGTYLVGVNLLATVFDGGRRAGRLEAARGRQQELLAAYSGAILQACADVEDALAGAAQFAAQDALQRQALEHAQQAYRIAEVQYRLGRTGFASALEAQRALLAAQAATDGPRLARFEASVALFLAAGGGW